MKTIFDVMGKNSSEIIKFHSHINYEGVWISATLNSDSFENCILISTDKYYNYYLCWDESSNLETTRIYREKINKSEEQEND